jgi:hypothetical protein
MTNIPVKYRLAIQDLMTDYCCSSSEHLAQLESQIWT